MSDPETSSIPCMTYDDFHGLLGDQPSSSQLDFPESSISAQQQEQQQVQTSEESSSAPVSMPFQAIVPVPVYGDDSHRLSTFTKQYLAVQPTNRARTAVLEFGDRVPHEELSFFVRHQVSNVMDKRNAPGGYGFTVKTVSYFVGPNGAVYVVFVGVQPQSFIRWLLVCDGLNAIEITVLHYSRSIPGKNQAGLLGVASVFEKMTTIEQLLRNRIIIHDDGQVIVALLFAFLIVFSLTPILGRASASMSGIPTSLPSAPRSLRPRRRRRRRPGSRTPQPQPPLSSPRWWSLLFPSVTSSCMPAWPFSPTKR